DRGEPVGDSPRGTGAPSPLVAIYPNTSPGGMNRGRRKPGMGSARETINASIGKSGVTACGRRRVTAGDRRDTDATSWRGGDVRAGSQKGVMVRRKKKEKYTDEY